MAVYIDDMNAKYGRMTMCHMIADTDEELRKMALRLFVQYTALRTLGAVEYQSILNAMGNQNGSA